MKSNYLKMIYNKKFLLKFNFFFFDSNYDKLKKNYFMKLLDL